MKHGSENEIQDWLITNPPLAQLQPLLPLSARSGETRNSWCSPRFHTGRFSFPHPPRSDGGRGLFPGAICNGYEGLVYPRYVGLSLNNGWNSRDRGQHSCAGWIRPLVIHARQALSRWGICAGQSFPYGESDRVTAVAMALAEPAARGATDRKSGKLVRCKTPARTARHTATFQVGYLCRANFRQASDALHRTERGESDNAVGLP